MSKELEAYNRLCNHLDYDNDDYMFNGQYEEDNAVIETALENYDTLKNDFISMRDFKYKQLDALDIIKDKKVDVPYIIENPEEKDVIWYNSRFMGVLCEGWRMLNQEEYDLLREVLLDE